MMLKIKPGPLLKISLLVITASSVVLAERPSYSGNGMPHPTQVSDDSITKEVDELFAAVNTNDSPGAALAVIKDGKTIYKRGYGMANLEYDVRVSPATLFHVGSMSKQFTAMAIQMLAHEGRLSLDDPVRKFVPELHDFGKTLTVRNLINHTSGLREQLQLLFMSGWRLEDVITENDLLHLILRQRELNFEPGTEYLYSNTNYTLLALIVARVSGKSLGQFTYEKIFKPLGMNDTRFRDDYRTITKNLALSYIPTAQGIKHMFISGSYVGASGLMTTVEDLALWDKNFYGHQVGGQEVIERMLARGRLNDGQEINYASGLNVGKYRGLKTVEHSGEDAGYQADFLQFPEQRFTVVVLSNSGAFDAVGTARRVADLYLADDIKRAPPDPVSTSSITERAEVKLRPEQLDALVGAYKLSFGIPLKLSKQSGKLVAQVRTEAEQPLLAVSATELASSDRRLRIRFMPPERRKYVRLKIDLNGQKLEGERIEMLTLSRAMAQAYSGTYYSEELGALYSVSYKNGKLMLWHRRGEEPLMIKHEDQFSTGFSVEARGWRGGEYARVRFLRDRQNRVTGFLFSMPTALNTRFLKLGIRSGK